MLVFSSSSQPSIDLQETYSCTNSLLGSSFRVELPTAVVVSRYTIRSDKHSGCKLRHWLLEGSKNGVEWSVLSTHNDAALEEAPASTATWYTNPDGLECSQFRLVQTGPNSSGGSNLMCAGLELYGTVPQRTQVRTLIFFMSLSISKKSLLSKHHIEFTTTPSAQLTDRLRSEGR